jgi:hypothetical protein
MKIFSYTLLLFFFKKKQKYNSRQLSVSAEPCQCQQSAQDALCAPYERRQSAIKTPKECRVNNANCVNSFINSGCS